MSKVTSKWSAVNCFKEHAYICALSLDCPTHTKSKGECPATWTYFERTHSCYKIFHWKSQTNAEIFCEEQRSHLASIHSIDENNFIVELSLSDAPYSEKTWIGLRDLRRPTGTSEYSWMDGTQLDYVIWERYVSVNASRCIAISTDAFYWVEHDCNQLSAFVCKRSAE
uniref:Struthiocalcin-2 n=1 Tax=Ascaris suum TaxID=6253 RepID=F1LEV6_ASCSU